MAVHSDNNIHNIVLAAEQSEIPEETSGTGAAPKPAGEAAAGPAKPLYRPFSRRAVIVLLLPIIIEQFLANLGGLLSSMMVAFVGEDAISGVSMVEFIMMFFLAVFGALAAGGTVISGQYLGHREKHNARGAADQLLRFAILAGVCVTVLVFFGRTFIIDNIFGSITPGVRTEALTYMTIVVFAIPSMPIYCACAAIFRTVGYTRLPMMASMVMVGSNLAMAAAAVLVLDAGTFGVAVASLVSRWAGCLFLLFMVFTKTFPIRPYAKLYNPLRWDVIGRILRIGVPFGIENGLFHVGRIAILGLVATYGTTAIAANAVGGIICFFCVLPGMAVCFGGTAVISRCVGAGDYEAARYYTRMLLKIAYISHVVVAIIIVAVLPFVMEAYGLSEETSKVASAIVYWHLAMDLIFWPTAFCLPVTFRSAGDVRYPMMVSVIVMFLCRVVLAWVFGTVMGMGVLGTWYAMFADWIVRTVCFVHRYRSGKWTTFKSI
ncbi:MAG: MATE family efflux transporter [Desulfovibrionaceae bacterium]|nr:MATE family efflux transporter [Desulfovibrionaceae bacterium]